MALDFSRKPAGFNTIARARMYSSAASALLAMSEDVCRHLLPAGRRDMAEWRVGSIHGERGKSMGVNLKTGIWKDFDGGEGGADLLSLWAEKRGVKMHEAYDEAVEWLGRDDLRRAQATAPRSGASGASMLRPAVSRPVVDQGTREDDDWWRKARAAYRYEYVDAKGSLWATVCRFERPGEKVIRPWDHKRQDWRWPEGLRPLYDLPGLASSPDPVILVEGEKCAERLKAMGYTVTTMAGGSNAAAVTDWTPLRGREVIRWSDNDYPRTHPETGKPLPTGREKWNEGTLAGLSIARAVRDVPYQHTDKPDGWDCADASDPEVRHLIEQARRSKSVASAATGSAPPISPQLLELPPIADIPKRRFVYDNHYLRGAVSTTAGEGGSGKSILQIVEAIAIATGKDLLKTGKPIERCSVWLISLEDDKSEIHRRVAAVLLCFEIDRSELEGWLYVTTQADAPDFLLASTIQGAAQVDDRSVGALVEGIVKNDIGCVIIDPYVYAHSVSENDNGAQAAIMKALSGVAISTKCAIGLSHHAKKSDPSSRSAPSANDSRGAGAILNGSRRGRIVGQVGSSDAAQLGVPNGQHPFFIQVTGVKANYGPRDAFGKLYRLRSITLPNGVLDEEGDSVGVPERWEAPDLFAQLGITVETLRNVQHEVERALGTGNPYRASDKSKKDPWVGDAIATAAGLDLEDDADKARAKKIQATWTASGALIVDKTTWKDASRQPRAIVRSGSPA